MDSWHVSSKADARTSYDLFRDMVTCSKDFLRSISSLWWRCGEGRVWTWRVRSLSASASISRMQVSLEHLHAEGP
jgi:hypothetical protein